MVGNDSFGEWLRQRRKALDLTQAELADQVGCSTVTIRKIEADERRPSKQISERMADVLAIALEDRDSFTAFARQAMSLESFVPEIWDNQRPSNNLPPQLTPFVGRGDELAQIAERLANPDCRLLTLVGPGGIGKTRLALQAAVDQLHAFRDGVYFVSLTPVGATTFIPAAIANALGFSFYGQDEPQVQIVNFLRNKQMLLLMDNYEHLLGGIDLLADLLANAPRLTLLITSRERLNLKEEWLLPVTGLPYPAHSVDKDLNRYAAVSLFVETARRTKPSFVLDGNEGAVAEICRAVEGMPLGLELAASWLRAMPCEVIAGQIQRDLDFLATPLRNVPDRHRSLRAVFEHSWDLLDEDERTALAELSVFRGGCDTEAAASLAGADLMMLAGLVDKSLLRFDDHGRYDMQELLRQFAAEKLAEADQVVNTRNGHLQCYLDLAETLEMQFFGPQNLATLDRLETEHDNMRAALDWAAESGNIKSGLRLAGALGWFWNRRSYMSEGRNRLETFLVADAEDRSAARAKALHHLLELSSELGDFTYVIERFEQALNLARDLEDRRIKAWLLCSLGFFATYVHNPQPDEQTLLEEALALFRQIGDMWGICETLLRMGGEAFSAGDFIKAKALQDEAIKLTRQAGDTSVLSWTLFWAAEDSNPADINRQHKTHLYQESLSLFRKLGFKNGMSLALSRLSDEAYSQGETEQAELLLAQSFSWCSRQAK